MYLQTQYKVVATTDIEVVQSLICSKSADLVILDSEPSSDVQIKCEQFKKCRSEVPVIITYVFNNRLKDLELAIKKFVSEIYYKPFDLNEISARISTLLPTS